MSNPLFEYTPADRQPRAWPGFPGQARAWVLPSASARPQPVDGASSASAVWAGFCPRPPRAQGQVAGRRHRRHQADRETSRAGWVTVQGTRAPVGPAARRGNPALSAAPPRSPVIRAGPRLTRGVEQARRDSVRRRRGGAMTALVRVRTFHQAAPAPKQHERRGSRLCNESFSAEPGEAVPGRHHESTRPPPLRFLSGPAPRSTWLCRREHRDSQRHRDEGQTPSTSRSRGSAAVSR